MSTKQRQIWSVTMYGLFLWAFSLWSGPLESASLLAGVFSWTAVWWLVLPQEPRP